MTKKGIEDLVINLKNRAALGKNGSMKLGIGARKW